MIGWPAETMPHRYAHIGGNQVIGLMSSSSAEGSGRWRAGVSE